MKRVVSIICVAALLFSVLCLAGCGLNGTYKLKEIKFNGESIDPSDYGYNKDVTLTIKNKEATFDGIMSDQTMDVDTKNKQLKDDDGNEYSYTVDGKKITVTIAGLKYVFEKK